MFKLFDIDYTTFVRTSDEKHKATVQHFWKNLVSQGFIYKTSYSGWYCVADETFLTDSQIKLMEFADGSIKRVSAESGRSVEWAEEENYKFNLSHFKDDLLHWLKDENVVKPKKFYRILKNYIQEGEILNDISVSRPAYRVHWGIPVPGDETQTVYVWLDALLNYLTAAGYSDQKSFTWPPSVHVIGKDILKFHGVYWPAFLIAAGLEPPASLIVHSHWTVNNEKMSKTTGNVINPIQSTENYTASGLRYALLREGTPHSDGNFKEANAIQLMNADLADTLGNLLSRCTGKIINADQKFPAFSLDDYNKYCKHSASDLQERIAKVPDKVAKDYHNFNFYTGVQAIMLTAHEANKFFEINKPWELRKYADENSKRHLNCILSVTMETLRICGIGLLPIVPKLATAILDKLNIDNNKRTWNDMYTCCFASDQNNRNESTDVSKQNAIIYKRVIIKNKQM
ncbi:methionyl-tRNA synthetase, mitochondrial isoform X2 [Lycorma delicatula]